MSSRGLIQFRRTFLGGIIVMVPLVITVKVMQLLFVFTDSFLGPLVRFSFARILHRDVHIPGLGLLLFLLLIYIAGLATRSIFGKHIIYWTEQFIERLPLVRTIYSGIKQLLDPFLGEDKKTFGKAVLVEYPKGFFVYAFVVNDQVRTVDGREYINLYIPTNHLHLGFIVMVERSSIIEIGLSFEQVITLNASCGAAVPTLQWKRMDATEAKDVATPSS